MLELVEFGFLFEFSFTVRVYSLRLQRMLRFAWRFSFAMYVAVCAAVCAAVCVAVCVCNLRFDLLLHFYRQNRSAYFCGPSSRPFTQFFKNTINKKEMSVFILIFKTEFRFFDLARVLLQKEQPTFLFKF